MLVQGLGNPAQSVVAAQVVEGACGFEAQIDEAFTPIAEEPDLLTYPGQLLQHCRLVTQLLERHHPAAPRISLPVLPP